MLKHLSGSAFDSLHIRPPRVCVCGAGGWWEADIAPCPPDSTVVECDSHVAHLGDGRPGERGVLVCLPCVKLSLFMLILVISSSTTSSETFCPLLLTSSSLSSWSKCNGGEDLRRFLLPFAPSPPIDDCRRREDARSRWKVYPVRAQSS